MRFSFVTALFALASAGLSVARPVVQTRANTTVNPAAITGTTCTSKSTYVLPLTRNLPITQWSASHNYSRRSLVSHDINVALLSICGGIAGTIEFCGGNPSTTTGVSGTAKFSLGTTVPGATINISKGRWEGCIRAAEAVCGLTPYTTTCIGGASEGNVAVTLTHS